MAAADLTFIAEQLKRIQFDLHDLRNQSVRLERRVSETSLDMGIVVKLEVSNGMMRLEDKLDRIIDDHERRLAKLEDAAP